MVQSKSEDLAVSIEAVRKYEASRFVQGPVSQDDFYTVPLGQADAAPGQLLKVEVDTNITRYNLPPATTLSRILYQSRTLQGSPVPASAYILWPYQPRLQADGSYRVVAWAHGTTGFYPDAAPSHTTTLPNLLLQTMKSMPFRPRSKDFPPCHPNSSSSATHRVEVRRGVLRNGRQYLLLRATWEPSPSHQSLIF